MDHNAGDHLDSKPSQKQKQKQKQKPDLTLKVGAKIRDTTSTSASQVGTSSATQRAMEISDAAESWSSDSELRERYAQEFARLLMGSNADLTERATLLSILQQTASNLAACGREFAGAVVAICEEEIPGSMIEWVLSGLEQNYIFAKKHAGESWMHLTAASIIHYHDPSSMLSTVVNDLLVTRDLISRSAGLASSHRSTLDGANSGNAGGGMGVSAVAQLRFVKVLDTLTDVARRVSGLFQIRMHFPTLVNAVVGMCASYPVPGKETAELLNSATRFLLRPEFESDWISQEAVYTQMFYALDQDMHSACQQTDFSTRTTGVLTAWLIIYVALKRIRPPVIADVQLDKWAQNSTRFAQLLFAQCDWAALDLLAIVCSRWVPVLETVQGVNQVVWSQMTSALSCALRRPSSKAISVVLPALGRTAAQLDESALLRMLEDRGGAILQLLLRRNSHEDALKSFYKYAFTKVSFEKHLKNMILQSGQDPPSWANFLIQVGLELTKANSPAQTCMSAPSSKALRKALSKLREHPELQTQWLELVLVNCKLEHGSSSKVYCSLIETAAKLALKQRRRSLLILALQSAPDNSLSPVIARACTLGNAEDVSICTLAVEKTSDKALVLALLDAANPGVQRIAAARVGCLEFAVQGQLLSRAQNFLDHIWAVGETRSRGFEHVDDYLQQVLTCGMQFVAHRISADSNLTAVAHSRRAAVASVFADQLVQRKLRSYAGPASQTLMQLDHLIHAVQAATLPSAPMKTEDAVAHVSVGRALVFHLERAILLAADAGARIRAEEAQEKESASSTPDAAAASARAEFGTKNLPVHVDQSAEARKACKFFDKNRQVCQNWLRNTRKRILDDKYASTPDADFIWHAWRSLLEVPDEGQPNPQILRKLGQALVQRCEDASIIKELNKWVPATGSDIWERTIAAAALQSHESYEEAARMYASATQDLLADRDTLGTWDASLEALRWNVQGAMDCLVASGDTTGVSQWSMFLTQEQESAWEASQEALADALTCSASSLYLSGPLANLTTQGCVMVPSLLEPISRLSPSLMEDSSRSFSNYWTSKALLEQVGMIQSAADSDHIYGTYEGLVQADRALQKDFTLAFLSGANHRCLSRYQTQLWAVRACGLRDDLQALPVSRIEEISSLPAMWWPLRLATEQARPSALLVAARKAHETGNMQCAQRLLLCYDEREPTNENESDSVHLLRKFLAAPDSPQSDQLISQLAPAQAHTAHMELGRLETEPETRKVHLWHACETASSLVDSNIDGMCWYEFGQLCENEGDLESAVSAYAKFVCWSSGTRKMLGLRTAACLRLLGMVPQLEAAVSGDECRASLAKTPTLAWTQLLPQVLAGAARPSEILQGLALRIAREHPGRITWSIIAAREQLGEDLFRELRAQIPSFSGAEAIVAELVGSAIWLEERWYALIKRTLAQKMKTLEAIRSIQSNVYFDETTKRKSCRDVMQPSISNLQDHFEATFGSSVGPDKEDSPDDDFDSSTSSTYADKRKEVARPSRSRELRQSIGRAIQMMDSFEVYGVESAWDALESEERKLAAWLHMRQGDAKMREFAPKLFCSTALEGASLLRVPGHWDVGIHSFEDRIQALTSKTRPKRVWLRGMDGGRYGFLLKGGDDMRLDERVLQIGYIMDSLMPMPHSIRTYEVVALGQSVGLVQWVEGARPIMDIYEERCAADDRKALKGDAHLNVIHRRLAEAKGVSIDVAREIRRTDWPEQVVVESLRELEALVPRNLLARELCTTSRDAGDWWQRSKRYSRSLAGSSIFGYIMGLGDRHISNIMLDLSSGPGSGELVHIDYNVCFESGHRLAVPETVPFRLTQVLRDALPLQRPIGPEGERLQFLEKDGAYAGWARSTMQCMRNHKELIQSLVGSIVNDSSISWTGTKVKTADNSLNVNVSISLLASEVHLSEDDDVVDVNALLSLEEQYKTALDQVPSEETSLRHVESMLDDIEGGVAPKNQVKDDPRAVLHAQEAEIDELRNNLLLRREWLTEALQSIIQVQVRCDRMQAQLASGSIALQQGHVLPRVEASLTKSFTTFDVRRDAPAADLKATTDRAMTCLNDLQRGLKQYGEASTYGSQTLVDDWLARLQILRSSIHEVLDTAQSLVDVKDYSFSDRDIERMTQSIRRCQQNIESTISGVNPDNVQDQVAQIAKQCIDPTIAWKHAYALDWFWNAGIGAFDRSGAALSAVKARLDLRRELLYMDAELGRSIEAFRRAGAQSDTSRRSVLESAESLKRVLSSVAKIEAQAADIRIPPSMEEDTGYNSGNKPEGTEGSSAGTTGVPMALQSWESMSLDAEFLPLVEETSREVFELARGVLEGLELMQQTRGLREAAKEIDEAEEARRQYRQGKLDKAEQLRSALENELEHVRSTALLNNAQVWANISNIRRGADQEGPFFELASDLIAQRTLSSQVDITLNRLVQCTQRIRESLRKLLTLARKGTGDFGRRAPDEETQRKRRQVKATEVLRRLDAKLSASEPVETLVATLTAQATSEKRLARMYEGWMPFV